jgi:hypothetical protein
MCVPSIKDHFSKSQFGEKHECEILEKSFILLAAFIIKLLITKILNWQSFIPAVVLLLNISFIFIISNNLTIT